MFVYLFRIAHEMNNTVTLEDLGLHEKICNCIQEQLMEIEILNSMFPNTGEFLINQDLLTSMNDFTKSKNDYVPPHIDFIVFIQCADMKLEMSVNLPTYYPLEEPDILVRCKQLNRKQQTSINTDMMTYMKTLDKGEICLLSLVLWLQHNSEKYLEQNTVTENHKDKKRLTEIFTRYWIYSHHIYNKRKREDILSTARELKLTGFCLPGKPGIICIEGEEENCKDWWKYIKSMCWKKIVIKNMESFDKNDKKFHQFEEVHFHSNEVKSNFHMDMGQLSKYLEMHGLSNAFNEIFGFSNVFDP